MDKGQGAQSLEPAKRTCGCFGSRTDENGNKRPHCWARALEAYARFSLKYPRAIFTVVSILLIVLAAIGVVGKPFLQQGEDGGVWDIKGHKQTDRDRARQEALDEFIKSVGNQAPRSEEDFVLQFHIVYISKKGKLFTEENLQNIWEVENVLFGDDRYTTYCELDYDKNEEEEPTCRPPASVLNVFYDYDNVTAKYSEDRQLEPDEGSQIIRDNLFEFGFHVDKKFLEGEDTEHSRSTYYFGLPLQNRPGKETNYTNSYEDDPDQRQDVYDEFLKSVRGSLFKELGMKAPPLRSTKFLDTGSKGDVEILFYSFILENNEFETVIFLDFGLAFLSILSVWVYMLIHLGSVFLATVGIFEVFMAFPVALFFYKLIFQIEYFDFLHLLVIFILLGIGADDVFVFTDAFKQSKALPSVGRTLHDRLSYTCKRASKAVFVTSFTTMAAFLASAGSALMPMQSFGIFAALCIVLLFAINVILMPASLVLWSGYTQWCVKNVCCWTQNLNCESKLPCCTCCHVEPEDNFNLPDGAPIALPTTGRPMDQEMSSAIGTTGKAGTGDETTAIAVNQSQGEWVEDLSQLRVLERFFNGRFFTFVQKAKWVIILIGAVLFGVGIALVTTFEPPSEAEQWWPDEHVFTKYNDIIHSSGPFPSSAEDLNAEVHLVWGLLGMTNDYKTFDPDDFGRVVYDDELDISSKEAQKHLLGVCEKVRTAKCRKGAELCKRDDNKNNDGESTDEESDEAGYLVLLDRSEGAPLLKEQEPCWIEEMDDWLKENFTSDPVLSEGLPLEPEVFMEQLMKFVETPEARINFPLDVGFIKEGDEVKLKYIQFSFESTYKPPAPHSKSQPILDSWDDFMDDVNQEAAENGINGVARGYSTGGAVWTWPPTQDSLVRNAIQGVILVFVLAFVVLNFATQNVVMASISVITVAGIVLTVLGLGIRGIMDWKLGIAESIISTILIGFSMDYTLHLADAYVESHSKDRVSRTRDALTHLGISVTAGALTTFISGIFLWGAILTFFTKFAFNITATIIASYLWSVLFFPALCLVIGPEHEFGNWKAMILAMVHMCTSRK